MEAPISSSLGAMGSLLGKLDELLRTAHRALSIKQLRNDLGVINTRLVELSKLNAPSLTAKYWMKDVRELSYDMDDCVDQFVHADADAKMDWIEKISGFKTRVEEANERHDRYKLDCVLSSTNTEVDHRLPTVDAKAAIDPVGIDRSMSELDRWLTDGEQQLRVASIVGVGGVGKSTLAQKIFCKQGEQFECRAFVLMAKKPDVRRILRSMLSQVRPHQPPEACEVHNLIHDLRKHLQDKRYFIIVDDLWATSAWDIVSRAFPEGNRGSRIVTTTKFEDVALACCGYKSKYIFKMKPLSDDDSKKIFISVVFGSGKGCPQQFRDVSDEITRKCGGLPLALISIANILASQPETIEHWEYVQNFMSNNLRTNPTFDDILKQALDLCYNSLSHCLKTCLLYLGVYPENYTIRKEDLVKQWVAEGFICATKEENIMEVAGSYFDKLVNLRLIQCIYINNNDKMSYVVHHMVLDLITYKSIEENFITIMDYSHMTVGLSDKVRRLSLHFGSATYATTPAGIGLSHVRSLVFLGLFNCMPSLVEFMLLRVLILHFLDDNGNKSFNLRGICELFRLTYLQITCNVTVKLPDQMQRLKHLETLEINARAVAVPSDIVHLSSLLHLRLRGERNLPAMIGNRKSVTLDPGASGTAISLDDTTIVPSPPVFLQTFELLPPICILSRLPEWMGQLRKLSILKIVVRELLSNDIDILAGLPELTVLSLHVRQPTAERIVFNRGTFPLLKCSKFWCGVLLLTFQEEAMPNLRRLKLGFNAHRGELYGNMLAGIEHLLNLQEIVGRIGAAAGAEESDWRAAKSAFKEAVCKHSRPSFDIRRVDCVDEECITRDIIHRLDETESTKCPVGSAVGNSSVKQLTVRPIAPLQPSGEACEGSNASTAALSVSGKDNPNHQQLAKASHKPQLSARTGPGGNDIKIGMTGLLASMAVKLGLDKLSSFLRASLTSPPTASSSSSLAVQDDLEDLRSLESTMRRIHAALQDAEEHWNIRDESTKLRLEELKEVAYDAEDVVDEYEYEVKRCKLEALERSASVPSSNNKRKRHEGNGTDAVDTGTAAILNELMVRARIIIKRYDEILKDYGNLALDISTLEVDVCEGSILGREHDKDKIVESLLSIEDEHIRNPISVLAIVGMGGLGKTTLAQLVYNDPRVRQSFDMLAWVCVSDQFNVRNITRKIIESLTDQKCEVSELANLQRKLSDKIRKQRVLLVLDDVWNEQRDCWEKLCTPLSKTRVCKIIVTTRSEAVARLVQTMPFYRIKFLSSDESWSLFKQDAFAVHQENDTPANLVEIGRSIVEKCDGLPLAIKTLASMLRCYGADEMRWRHVLESQLWNLEQPRSEILPALELSYKHMPIYLKRCFVTLSLFPKDHSLSEIEVLQLWKILDLLQCDGSNNENEIGRLYFGELVQRSFLQVHFQDHTMHDLIHDLACFLAGEEFFRLEGDTPIEIPRNARYMSVLDVETSAKISIASRSLRAIIVLSEWDVKIENPEALFLDCKKLRALSLGWSNLSDALRDYMGNLKLLRHLKYGDVEDDSPRPAPSGIGQLINLHRLPPILMSACGCNCNIRELRKLNKIRKLCIQVSGSVCPIEDANEAQLWSKKHLQSLKLYLDQQEYCDYCKQSLQTGPVTVTQEQLLDSLRPHYGLRKLTIEDYVSQKYPNWLGNASFYNLTKIVLHGSKFQDVPTLGELPSLKFLGLKMMDSVQQIGREFCSHAPGTKGFPSLTRLEFVGLCEWSAWSGVDDGDFPRLRTLLIYGANQLQSLPSAPFRSLVTLELRFCGNLATVPTFRASLRELLIQWCEGLNELPTLPSLLKLELTECPNLSAVGSLPSLTTLNLMFRHSVPKHEMLSRLLNYHPSLECVTIISDTSTCIPLNPQGLPSLRKLRLSCENLQYCDGLAGLTSLEELKVWGCPKLDIHDSLLPRQLQNLDIRKED